MSKMIKSNFQMIKLVWEGSKAWVLCTMAYYIINPLRNLALDVLLIGYIYNLIQDNNTFSDVIPVFIIIGIFYLGNSIFEAIYIGYVEPTGSIKIKRHIEEMLCRVAKDVPLASYDDAEYYEQYIFSLQNCTDTAKGAVSNMAFFIAYLCGGLMGIGLISSIEPVMCLFILFAILFSLYISDKKKKYEFQYKESIAKVNVQEEYIHRVFYVKEYARELRSIPNLKELFLDKFEKVETENENLTGGYGKKSLFCGVLEILNSRVFMYWFVMLVTVVLIYYKKKIEPGDLLIMTVSVGTVALYIGAIMNAIPAMNQIQMYYEKLKVFMNNRNGVNAEDKDLLKVINSIESIRFENVTFTYPNEERPVLKNITFDISKGESLAIVGQNGSGKSTLLKILMKLYTEYEGNIYINGINLRDIETESYRNMIGCVFQETNLYAMPIEDNVCLTGTDVDYEKMRKALSQSEMHELLSEPEVMKRDLTKEFSEDGIILSGGK